MDIKTFIEGGKFDQYQHFAIVIREDKLGIMPVGGGNRYCVCKRFGGYEIKSCFVYGNVIRIEICNTECQVDEITTTLR